MNQQTDQLQLDLEKSFEEQNPTAIHAENGLAVPTMSPTEELRWVLHNDWLDQCPADLKLNEELRIRWLKQNPFEKYLIALIILGILVLNDRKPENTEKNDDDEGTQVRSDDQGGHSTQSDNGTLA